MSDYLSKINISRASLTPLGRVFKIRQFFLYGFEKKMIS